MKQKSMKQNKCIFYTINPEVISPCLTSVNSFLSHNSGYDVKIFACNFVTNFSKRISTLLSKLKELHSDSNIEIIYKEAKNLEMDQLARLIYDSTGPITISDEAAEYIKNTFIVNLPYYVQKEILPSL